MTLNSVTLTGQLPGAGRGATATFVPSGWLTDGTDNELIPPAPVTVTLAGDGTFSVSLLATDNAAPQPAGWTWQVTFAGIAGVAAYSFSFFLPFSGGSPQDISDLAPVVPAASMAAFMPLPAGTPTAGQVPVATGSGQASAWQLAPAPPGQWLPSDNALLTANYPLHAATSTLIAQGATLYFMKLMIRQALTIGSLWWSVNVPSSGASTGTFAGLYSSVGVLLSGSAELGSLFGTTGGRQAPLTTPQAIAAGSFVWAALLCNLATNPTPNRSLGSAGANMNLTAAQSAFAIAGTGLSSLPGSITPSALVQTNAITYWTGAS